MGRPEISRRSGISNATLKGIEYPDFTPTLKTLWALEKAIPADWPDLTDRQQTVVMSVAWLYGRPWDRCPTFWKHATAGRWDDVIAELRDFGDVYSTRRGKEADYLEG
jgi:hypothetical protein